MPNPVAPKRSFGGLYGFISPFVKETVKDLELTKEQLPSKNEAIVPILVEKAALEADQHQLIKNSSYSTVTDSSTYGDSLDSLDSLCADFCARAAHLRLRRGSHSFFGYGAADGTSISKSALRDGYDYDWYEN
ncbi:unnamed protein product [Rotaria sp. Silwood1]|nr:unnamed protein product [Rotaria sp. Silwood1]CAF3686605.1 unnamed protein product [Rotaria sp. Silwood1]CAF3712529.1 unnamed protein product [Rotaria sp. Silwood1]CAF4687775.1 unnamed protein product [Rotaria sp. Silwood1]CAF4690703.1 unnamed protein product [Rotaria sp. Silwood1]